jgi:hypothetical protein
VRPPSIPDLHRRSGSIPGEPYLPSKQIDCTAGAVSSKAKSIHSGKESGKSRGPWGQSPHHNKEHFLLCLCGNKSAGTW